MTRNPLESEFLKDVKFDKISQSKTVTLSVVVHKVSGFQILIPFSSTRTNVIVIVSQRS